MLDWLSLKWQAPRSIRTRSLRGSSRNIHSNIVAKQQASNMHWKSIVNKLDHTLSILSDNYVSLTHLIFLGFHFFRRICFSISYKSFDFRSLPWLLGRFLVRCSLSWTSSFSIGEQIFNSNALSILESNNEQLIYANYNLIVW